MKNGNLANQAFLLLSAFVGWALCAAIMGVSTAVTSLENALVIHALGAPIVFAAISLIYFKRVSYTSQLQTAIVFVSFVVLMDFFVVALLIQKSFAMFASFIGTWLPFALIFSSAYLTSRYLTKHESSAKLPGAS